jgi:hypothetical protein
MGRICGRSHGEKYNFSRKCVGEELLKSIEVVVIWHLIFGACFTFWIKRMN